MYFLIQRKYLAYIFTKVDIIYGYIHSLIDHFLYKNSVPLINWRKHETAN